ncbi:MAG TPA: hypothetical protein VGH28_00400 [Polyangiaceae bacterium]
MSKILCSPGGKVYVTTDTHALLVGRGSKWRTMGAQLGDELFFEDIVAFEGRVLISTDGGLLEVCEKEIVTAKLELPRMRSYTHLAAGDGVLVVAGSNEAWMLADGKWNRIFR